MQRHQKQDHKHKADGVRKPLRQLLLALGIGLSWLPAQAADLEAELQRFITLYAPGEVSQQIFHAGVAKAHQQGKVSDARFTCFKARVTPAMMNELALIVAREQFLDAVRLAAVNQFLASAGGQKVIKMSTALMMQLVRDDGMGLPKGFEAQQLAKDFTPEELRQVEEFEKSPANADFKRYIDGGLQKLSENQAAKKRMTDAVALCPK